MSAGLSATPGECRAAQGPCSVSLPQKRRRTVLEHAPLSLGQSQHRVRPSGARLCVGSRQGLSRLVTCGAAQTPTSAPSPWKFASFYLSGSLGGVMMVLLRWTWVLEPICLPSHGLNPQPSWLSREGPQGSPVPGAHRLPASLLPARPSSTSLLSPQCCPAGMGREEPRTDVAGVALHADTLKARWAGVAWHCFAGLRASISGGAVLPS